MDVSLAIKVTYSWKNSYANSHPDKQLETNISKKKKYYYLDLWSVKIISYCLLHMCYISAESILSNPFSVFTELGKNHMKYPPPKNCFIINNQFYFIEFQV